MLRSLRCVSDWSRVELEQVGEFCTEVQNPCVVGSRIYNFYNDEFSDQRTIEAFDIRTG